MEVNATPLYNFLAIAKYEYNIMSYDCASNMNLLNEYVKLNGLPDTFEEAAPIFNELIVRELIASKENKVG